MQSTEIETIFNAALAKNDPGERSAFLDGACGNDYGLRQRVETLLGAHDEAGQFLDFTTDHSNGKTEEAPGSRIGPYKLLQQIGEGGFGLVYMAEQEKPIRRHVALKVIKLGMDTHNVVARFESERQALALMDHANIARVLDGGATESGRPYFVMELVRGIPITQYCEKNSLSPEERLKLFIPVCRAIQHAHHKGIIHRDIKPSNILITLHDGVPVPKVIDFGIAKATNQRLTEKTLFTEFRQFIGTPQYMSPEQAEMSGLDIDTRTDIYSLGVVLYELLTGTTPFEPELLREAGYGGIQQILQEQDPPIPSVRLSTMKDGETETTRHAMGDINLVTRQIRGELDWVVMKALEKDRTRRYDSANALAEDVENFLSNLPVMAGPPGLAYRIQKFIRRRRVAVMSSAIVALALLLGAGLAAYGFFEARSEARRSQEIADFLQKVLRTAHGDERTVEVAEVLETSRRLFGEDHATVAATLGSMALQLHHSGEFEKAARLYQESIDIWKKIDGGAGYNLGIIQSRLGSLQESVGDESAAEQSYRAALVLFDRDVAVLPSVCEAHEHLAKLMQRQRKYDEAEALFRRAIKLRRQQTGQDFQIAASLEHLTNTLIMSKREDDAELAFNELIDIYESLLPNDSLMMARIHMSFGVWMYQRGKFLESEKSLRLAVSIYRQYENPPREYYVLSLDTLFQLLRKKDDQTEESVQIFYEVVENARTMLGKDSVFIAPQLIGLANFLKQRKRSAEAIPVVIEGIRIYRAAKGESWDSQKTLDLLEQFTRIVLLSESAPEADYRTAIQGAKTLAAEQPDNLQYQTLVGAAHYRLNELSQALEYLGPVNKSEHATVVSLSFEAMVLQQLGESQAATAIYDAAVVRKADRHLEVAETNVFREAVKLLSGKK